MDRTLNENRANPTDPWMVNYLAYRRSLLACDLTSLSLVRLLS